MWTDSCSKLDVLVVQDLRATCLQGDGNGGGEFVPQWGDVRMSRRYVRRNVLAYAPSTEAGTDIVSAAMEVCIDGGHWHGEVRPWAPEEGRSR